MKKNLLPSLLCLTFTFMVLPGWAQYKSLTIDDLAKWNKINHAEISPNGKWVSYEINSEEGDPSSHFYQVATGNTYSFPRASNPMVSRNEKWAIFQSNPPEFVIKELKRKKVKKEKMPSDTLSIFTFDGNLVEKYPGLRSVTVPDSLSDYIIYESSSPFTPVDSTQKDPRPPRNEKNGFDLIIRQVSTQSADTIDGAKEWKLSAHGKDLIVFAKATDSSETDRWLHHHIPSGEQHIIYDEKGKVKSFSMSEDGQEMALIIDHDTTKSYQRNYSIYRLPSREKVDGQKNALSTPVSIDSSMEINPDFQPIFSENGEYLFFKYRKKPIVKDTLMLDDEKVDVEIWTTADPLIYPQQENNIKNQKKLGQLAVIESGNDSPKLIGDNYYDRYVMPNKSNGSFVLSFHNKKYQNNITWSGHDYKDIQATDMSTGQSWNVIDSLHGYPQLSPSGQWAYWWSFPDTSWMGYDLVNKKLHQWTNNHAVDFSNEKHDYPALPWPYGMAGFNQKETEIYIYDRYDVWRISTQSKYPAQCVTEGRAKELRHRNIKLNKNDKYVDSSSWLLYLFDEKTKDSGYAWLDLSKDSLSRYQLDSYRFSRNPKKAENADIYLFHKQDYSTFPDLLLTTIPTFKNYKKISDANPQQEDFYWGDIHLVEWNVNGKKRQGMVAVPDNFDPSRKYPLIVNFYEKSSDNLHSHRRPYLHRSTINYHFYTSRGYVIFNPDVNYRVGDPGLSATETVLSGVNHLLKQGFIDKKRMALQGHSWGGYQIAHILTKTDLFACAESGAPVVNMTSAYGGIRWGSGMSRMFQYEKTQSRLGATLWEDREVYLRNSPLFELDKVSTPVLILHNDEDGAVPWYQGIEYYMGLRRLGKKAWLLNYKGEPHWPLKFQNRKDFQTRMSQFFDHYLMDKPMPEWMEKGVPAHQRGLKLGY